MLANWVTVELVPRLGDGDPAESKVEPAALARLVGLVAARTVSQSAAKEVLDVLAAEGGDPAAIVEERSLGLAGADELEGIVERALEANPRAVEELKGGKQKAVGAIVGFVMRETKGRADGGEVQRLIREKLGAERQRGPRRPGATPDPGSALGPRFGAAMVAPPWRTWPAGSRSRAARDARRSDGCVAAVARRVIRTVLRVRADVARRRGARGPGAWGDGALRRARKTVLPPTAIDGDRAECSGEDGPLIFMRVSWFRGRSRAAVLRSRSRRHRILRPT